MKWRLCKRCTAAMQEHPDFLIFSRALAELGHYVCPFGKLECGKLVDATGQILSVTPLKDNQWLNRQ